MVEPNTPLWWSGNGSLFLECPALDGDRVCDSQTVPAALLMSHTAHCLFSCVVVMEILPFHREIFWVAARIHPGAVHAPNT